MSLFLVEDENRYVMFPIKDEDICKCTKTSRLFLESEEIDLSKDLKSWEKLDDNENIF